MSESKFIRIYQNIATLSRMNDHIMGELLVAEASLNLGDAQNAEAAKCLYGAWESLRDGQILMASAQELLGKGRE